MNSHPPVSVSFASDAVPALHGVSNGERARPHRRRIEEHVTGGPNAHQYWFTIRNERNGPILGPAIIIFNYLVINLAKHSSSLALKRWVFRRLGMKLGRNVTIASGVMMDYFYPELIEIGDNSIVGMDAMILTHEFLSDRWRSGVVRIGSGVLIGARSMILAGVTVGDGATISAMSFVNGDVPAGSFAGGNPATVIRPQRSGAP
jgi:acetyltransferase-like isoleucine patch superfamily enzyme